MHETILILDFGSQYTQLIARRVRELNIYCEIHPFYSPLKIDASVKGVILSGSPSSVRDENAPQVDLSQIRGKLPVLGICYGAQLMAKVSGGDVRPSSSREYGRAHLGFIDESSELMQNVIADSQVWMSHADTITELPDGFSIIASTKDVKLPIQKTVRFYLRTLQ